MEEWFNWEDIMMKRARESHYKAYWKRRRKLVHP